MLFRSDCLGGLRERKGEKKIGRDQTDLLAHDDDWLMSRFRLPWAILLELCAELGPALERETARNHALPVPLQVLTTLGFLATGAFQRELAFFGARKGRGLLLLFLLPA